MSTRNVADVPEVDRPISGKKLSSVGNFFGLYGGEHISATEFVIGATLVTWGCSALEIIIGLIIGNFLAVLSFTLLTAKMGVKTRLTLYSYLKKVLGPHAQKLYNAVWTLCSVVLAGSGICVSAMALREVVGIPIQSQWYPTNVGFIVIALVIGLVVTLIAANGFEACGKFGSACVPWMIIIFAVCGLVALPQLADATGVQISSIGDVWTVFSNNVGGGAEPYTIAHVACFAWLCNLAWHVGLNDMGLFRFAKSQKYGLITTIGMFIGHFFAWIMVAIMGAAAAAMLKTPLSSLDPGSVTSTVVGLSGICAVLIAGWTTANPTVYRCSLSLNTLFPKLSQKTTTYIIGGMMMVLACFPAMSNIGDIVAMLGWAVVGVGAICIEEEFLFPKIGFTKYWSMYKGKKVNWAAIITWAITIVFVVIVKSQGLIHRNFIFIPEYIIAAVLYPILAGAMGAKGDYKEQEAEEEAFEKELQEYVDAQAEKEIAEAAKAAPKVSPKLPKVLSLIGYAVLAVILITAIVTFTGGIAIADYKVLCFVLTIIYFILSGSGTYISYKSEGSVLR